MKKSVFAGLILCAVLLCGVGLFGGNASRQASAATSGCYRFPYDGQKIKIGSYYYRLNKDGVLQRSKSKSKNFKTVAKSNTSDYLSDGKKIYYLNYSDKKKARVIYRVNMDGKAKKKMVSTKKYITLSTIYNNKLYVAEGGEEIGYTTYSVALNGGSKLKLVQKELRLYNERQGQYILGAEWEPTDVSPYMICVYNAKTNKKIRIGVGTAAHFIDKELYYASWEDETFKIKKCNPDGTNVKELAVLENDTVWYVYKVTKTYCEGYSTDGDGLKVVRINY